MTMQHQAQKQSLLEKKHTELRQFQQFMDTANTLIFSTDNKTRIKQWNKAAEHLSGYPKNTVIGHRLMQVMLPYNKGDNLLGELIQKALSGQESSNIELSIQSQAATRIDLLLNIAPRRDANECIIGVMGIGQDITELNVSKAQTIQASKLATLGEMTTSVAHELNQPLNVMRMALGNCRRKLENGNIDLDYYLSKIERLDGQVSRMASIVNHMRMFGRKASESFVPLNLRDVVDSSFNLMGEQLRLAGIEIRKNFCAAFSPVMGHQIQLEQVLLNLIGNARDAMNAQGVTPSKKLWVNIAYADSSATITIEDNGGGLPKDKIDRIFDPFFTTKAPGQGTGLGLSVSYGIIKDMGGQLTARNTAVGAQFTIVLPTITPQP